MSTIIPTSVLILKINSISYKTSVDECYKTKKTINQVNEYLSQFDDILSFPAYIKFINKNTYKVNRKILNDYLFMYGKIKPCIRLSKLYSFIDYNVLYDIPTLVKKYDFDIDKDFEIDDSLKRCKVLISPKVYYHLVFSSNIDSVISQFNKLFLYEYKYNSYLKMKNQ